MMKGAKGGASLLGCPCLHCWCLWSDFALLVAIFIASRWIINLSKKIYFYLTKYVYYRLYIALKSLWLDKLKSILFWCLKYGDIQIKGEPLKCFDGNPPK